MKCNYCENEASKRDYRTWDGQTGKEFVCEDCFSISNKGLLKRKLEITMAFEECFINPIDSCVEEGMNAFWDAVNIEVNQLTEEFSSKFKKMVGIDAHNSTIEVWREKLFESVIKEVKNSIS